jgi:hypothetical protein
VSEIISPTTELSFRAASPDERLKSVWMVVERNDVPPTEAVGMAPDGLRENTVTKDLRGR